MLSVLFMFWFISSLIPELTIRRYLLFSLQPTSSITSELINKERYDREYGYLYLVDGYKDLVTKGEMNVFYLKKLGPFWRVSSVGTGP